MAIKIRQKTDIEINRVIKNFNQKINRLNSINKELLPSKITKKELMSVGSRQELNRKLNQLKRFSDREAAKIVTLKSGENITNWEKKETTIELRSALSKISKRIKHYESSKPRIGGKTTAVTFAQMGDSQYLQLIAQRNRLKAKRIEDMNKKEIALLKTRTSKILQKGRTSIFRDSYKQIIIEMAYQTSYNYEKMKVILDNLKLLTDDQFLNLYDNDKLVRAIIDYYKSLKQGMEMDYNSYVTDLFDEIHDNITEIISSYKKEDTTD